MATRKSEWLASIKPILDRDEAKRDAAALAKELGDILEVKVDASPENLDELAKEFNTQLKTMGKQPIVFSEKTLSGIVSQFANAIVEGISQGIVNGAQGGMKESLQQLRLQQADLKRERARIQAELNKKVTNKKDYNDLLDFDGESVHSLEIDGDVLEEAKKQYNEFLKIGQELNKIQKEQGVDSKEYVKALYDAEGKLHDLYKIRKTLQKLETPVPTGLKAAYGLLDPYTEQPKYEQKMEDAGKKPMLPFYETRVGNFVGDSWERYVESIRQGEKQLSNIDNQMSAIDAQIVDITKSIQASGDAVNVVVDNANNGLKTLNEIEEKYRELTDKLEFQNKQRLNSAINYKPHIDKDGEIADGIKAFANDYTEAVASGDWTKEYGALLKYVRLYESYLEMGTKAQRNKITAKGNPFTPLYNQLKPMADNAENMLKNVVNMMEGRPLVGMGGAEKEKPQDTSMEAANAERISEATKATADEEARAREEAEKKAQADKESEEANRKAREEAEAKAKADAEAEKLARQRHEEEERLAKAAEKKKLADEAAIEARKEELGLMQAMEKFQGEFEKTDKKNETLAFVNTKTGDMSDLVVGDTHGVTMGAGTSRKMSERGYDMEVHSHSWKTAAPSVEDFEEWFRQLEYIKKFGIRAGEELLAFDFSNLDPSKLLEIIEKYADLDEKITTQVGSMSVDEKLNKFGSYQGIQEGVQVMLRQGLEEILQDIPGVMKSIKMPELPVSSIYNEPKQKGDGPNIRSLSDVFADANEEVKELIKNYAILAQKADELDDDEYDRFIEIGDKLEEVAPDAFLAPTSQWQSFGENFINEADSVKTEADAHKQNTEAIKEEAAAQEKLNSVQNQSIDVDDDSEVIAKENGELEDKLELLQDIAEQYGNNISQKQRDRYEELNQKDMNEGLTPKEDERYWELGEQIEEADSALEEFGKTYDKIIVKLENGKKVEILPDDKGLRTLAKIDDEYGESYNGVEIEDVVFERVKKEAVATEQAVDGLNESLEKTQQLTSGDGAGAGAGAGDASLADLEAERAKSEALQDELDHRIGALQAAHDEKEMLQSDLNIANEQIKIAQDSEVAARARADETDLKLVEKDKHIQNLEEQLANTKATEGDALWTAEQRANEAEERANQLERKLAETFDGDKKQGSVNAEELKTLLNSIVYNVKIAHDDSDKTANKIALDDSTLEATLTKVFANILNPQTQQNDSEQTEKRWALESTLQTVKSVLDNIHTNTMKIGAEASPNDDNVVGSTLDGRLIEIKSVLESINRNITKGKSSDGNGGSASNEPKQANNTNKRSGNSNATKSLIKDYENLGKLRAQFDKDGNLETKAKLQNLEEEIRIKRESVKLTADEVLELEKKHDLAYKAEQRLLDAAKAQKVIDDQKKAADRDAKKQEKDAEAAWKKQVKDAQRATGINAATTAANAGDQTVVRAIGTEGVSKDVENKAKELSNHIKTLRMLRDEIDKKGEQASTEDRDNLSKQITKVKELKTELDGYLKIHEKYSGEGVTQFNDVDTSNFGAVGTDQYWNNITAAIKKASTGRVTIKGMNTDTGELTGTTKIAANTFAEWSATVDPVTGKLSMLRTGIKRTETIIESITRKTKEIFTYFSGSSIIFKAVNELKKGIQYVREIDLALTELKKVTDETEETYDRFLKTASKTGARLGSTISAVTEATATFAKLGYTIEQASEMAEAAIVYKNVGDNIASTEDAANSIISTMKGFGIEASESMAIVDKFNEVGNRFAITSQGIGEALRLSASALNEGKNSLDESIALITAANEVVNDPSSVGTALKTLTLRLRGSKTELEEMGEDVTDMATTTSQLQAKLLALTGGKVDIMLDANTFKNSTQILREMASAWEDMSDVQRASALELMGGKRQANVLSALIKNFDTVEDVIETSTNSAGSALKENERWLDSIAGKMDQFNNAVQSLWQNLLGSDVIKWAVEWVTKIIKSLDTTQGKILAIVKAVAILAAYKKINPLDWIKDIGVWMNTVKDGGGIMQWIKSLLGLAPAMKAVTAETLANTIATQTNDAAKTKQLMTDTGLATATGALSTAQKEQAATAILSAMTSGQLTMAQGNAMLAMLGYTAAVNGADISLKALDATTKSFMASNPIGWILLAVSAVVMLVGAISKIPTAVEKANEGFADLKSEISDVESEINNLNSELKTTEERMATLLGMQSLSLVEEEELENLKLRNAELQRYIENQEALLTSLKNEQAIKAESIIASSWNDNKNWAKAYRITSDGIISEGKGLLASLWNTFWSGGSISDENTKTALDEAMSEYQREKEALEMAQNLLSNPGNYSEYEKYVMSEHVISERHGSVGKIMTEDEFYKKLKDDPDYDYKISDENLKGWVESYKTHLPEIAGGINSVFANENWSNLQYGMSDEINAFLDEIYAYQYKWQDIQGIGSKSSAIASIFDDTSSESIKELKDDLIEIANDGTLSAADRQKSALDKIHNALDSTDEGYKRLKNSMDIIGITADEVARYFVLLGKSMDSSTVEGISAQYQKGIDILSKYKGAATDVLAEFTDLDGNIEKITWESLFDDDGEAIDSQISKVMQGTSDTVRKEFARLVENINEEKMSVDNAMKYFSLSGAQAGYKLLETSVTEINSSIFKDLGDEISGLIDTFEEFGSTLESVAESMELVSRAEAEMAYSGHLSVETALELINSTEDWNKVLKIENGNITLVDGAMDILAQSKLDQIKTNLHLALSEAQVGLEQARLAESSNEVTKTIEESTNEAVRQLAANMEYLSTLIGEFLAGHFLSAGSTAAAAKKKSLDSTTYEKTSSTSSMSVSQWEKKVSDIEAKLGILESVDTTGEFEDNYYSDKVSGGNDTKEEVLDDAFQREMEYWENRIAANQAKYEQLQNEIDLLEAKGQKADASFYEEQIELEKERLWLLGEQKKAAQIHLTALKEGSEEWWEVANTLNDIEGELDDVTASIVDLQDAIGEIETYKFEEFNTRLDNITSKLETIRDIIAPDEEDWFDYEGGWTEDGVAVLGTHLQELEAYKQGYQETMDELAKYEPAYEGNEVYYETLGIHSEQEYYDKTEELISQQYDYAKSISDTEQSVVDMYESNIDAVEEYTQTLIDSYNDYIDGVKEALDAERDLYNFKKNIQKQTKNIADLERRIASLSGSTNASDIAERRRLEADLYGAREELDDTYYEHARDAQSEALDKEAEAYEESMNNFIEGLRTSLDQATTNMDEFLMGVTSMVMYNADTVLAKYEETNLPLTKELTNPWDEAKKATNSYSGNALELMNQWTKQGGFFSQFNATGTTNLSSPWNSGTTAANSFKTSVATVMSGVVSNISANVKTASGELSRLYQQIQDTEKRAASANVNTSGSGSGSSGSSGGYVAPQKKYYVTAFLDMGSRSLSVTKSASSSSAAMSAAKIAILGEYEKVKGNSISAESAWQRTWRDKVKYTTQYYAKGTTGTKRDEFAITDEPQFGDELILVPGKDGNLSFMRKGTGVVPADLTANLMEWGRFTPDSMNLGGGVNVNMINNAVNKPEFNFTFDALVKAERIDENTLPEVKKFVQQEINNLVRQMNYAIKGKGGR